MVIHIHKLSSNRSIFISYLHDKQHSFLSILQIEINRTWYKSVKKTNSQLHWCWSSFLSVKCQIRDFYYYILHRQAQHVQHLMKIIIWLYAYYHPYTIYNTAFHPIRSHNFIYLFMTFNHFPTYVSVNMNRQHLANFKILTTQLTVWAAEDLNIYSAPSEVYCNTTLQGTKLGMLKSDFFDRNEKINFCSIIKF